MADLARRSLLMAAPAIAVLATVPAYATKPANSAAWDAAMRAHLRAKAEADAFAAAYQRIAEAFEAGRVTMDQIDWSEFQFVDRNEVAHVMDLNAAWKNYLAGEGKWWWGASSASSERMKARYRAALDSVQAYREAKARHAQDSGMEAADEKAEALGDREHETRWALMDMPAPNLRALLWKLEYLLASDESQCVSWSTNAMAQTVADMRRLLGEA